VRIVKINALLQVQDKT